MITRRINIQVFDIDNMLLKQGFLTMEEAAAWCDSRGYAHPLLEHDFYHANGQVSFACML